jgi:glycosyltransferase involved in cell wall biosynthesis
MPAISVVLATYNRAGRLRACLDALDRQTCALDDFEVVLVDDGSSDHTRELLESYRPRYRLRPIYQSNAGQPRALNRGVEAAGGRFCLLLDDDIIAEPDLVSEHLAAQRTTDTGLLAMGRLDIVVPPDADWFVRAFAKGWERRHERLGGGTVEPTIADCYSGNLSFPRAAFMAVGGFATEFARGYDIELAFRLLGTGLRLAYLPRASASQDERKRGTDLVRDDERAGTSAWQIYQRTPAMLDHLGLGEFEDQGPLTAGVRRALLAINLPPAWLLRAGRGRRWARFVRRYAFWRGVRTAVADGDTWERLTTGVSILMYHAIGREGETGSRYILPAREFAWQLRWLRRNGYPILGLAEYLRCRAEWRLPPARSVILTFDDGYMDNADLAEPLLAAGECSATIFLVTDLLGTGNSWDRAGALVGRPLMSWSDAARLEGKALSFGPHSRSHRPMRGCDAETLTDEIGGSWAAVVRHLRSPVPVFAFPFGAHDDAACEGVEAVGLAAALTVRPGRNGPAAPLMRLRRLEVRGDEGRSHFRMLLRAGTDRWRRRQGGRPA